MSAHKEIVDEFVEIVNREQVQNLHQNTNIQEELVVDEKA